MKQAPPAPAPSVAEPRATVELPEKGFDVTHVIGHSKTEVDKELGHGEQLDDGPWNYDGFGKVAVTVMFDSGKTA